MVEWQQRERRNTPERFGGGLASAATLAHSPIMIESFDRPGMATALMLRSMVLDEVSAKQKQLGGPVRTREVFGTDEGHGVRWWTLLMTKVARLPPDQLNRQLIRCDSWRGKAREWLVVPGV